MKTSIVTIFIGFVLMISIIFLWSRSPQYAHAYPPGVGRESLFWAVELEELFLPMNFG